MRIRKGDQVQVISGKDKGKRGRVLVMFPAKQRAIVEGVNLVRKHTRPNPQRGVKGGIAEQPAPIHLSNLMPIDPSSGNPTRVRHKFLEESGGARRKVRVTADSGEELDR
jgi:large subunit ribosomal protein L24